MSDRPGGVQYLASGDYAGAERLCLKAQKIHSTPAGQALLNQIQQSAKNPSQPQASTSSATSSASASTANIRHRKADTPAASSSSPKPEPAKREYTADQLAHVKRIRSCNATAYYEILNIKDKECSDAEIKKAYRKHSLLLHPDKNGAPGSDEAFKRGCAASRSSVLGADLQCSRIHSGIYCIPSTLRCR